MISPSSQKDLLTFISGVILFISVTKHPIVDTFLAQHYYLGMVIGGIGFVLARRITHGG